MHVGELQWLLQDFHSVSPPERDIELLDEAADPAVGPDFWISRWADYTDDNGLGYQLCDSSVGVLFCDNTCVMLQNDGVNVIYVDEDGLENHHLLKDYPSSLKKKIILLKSTCCFLEQRLVNTGRCVRRPAEGDSLVQPPCLGTWLRSQDSISFYLTNGTLQINFKDHTKVILCPSMAAVSYINSRGIGTGILLGITDSPEDASVLEEAAQYPNAGAVKELISYHQRGVNVFFTVIWGVIIFFAIFMIAAIIQFIYIMCTGQFQHHVRESNMGVYIFCVIAVIVLLLVMIVLLVCLMGCRSALVDSTDDKVPAVYSSTFDNLRKFVRVTAVESSRVDDRSPRVKRVLESGFHRAFEAFLARAARTDSKVPLFRLASDCNENGRLGPAHVAGDAARLPGEASALAQQCTRLRRSQQALFDKMARTVEASTVEYRRELSELLSDLSFVTDASDNGAVLSSVESIDRLQKSVDEYENNKGTFAALAKDAHNDFFWINILLLVCLIVLVITLLMGVAIHDKTAKPPKRSKLSHIIGFLFVITAFLFAIFVIIAIFDTMYLTTVNALGHCYFCDPYINEKYYVLDDALERLWPSNNRSLFLSKITPSKVMRNCVNDSVPSLALSRKLNHRKYVERNFYHDPAQRLRMEYELRNSPLSSHRDSNINSADDSFPFDEILCLPNGSTSLLEQPTRTCRGDVRKSLGKLTALGGTGVQLYMDDVEKTMLRKAPFYFSRFVERVVDAVHSSASTGDGRCSTLRSILSSFMDVVCYTYVLELVSYWASLMLATFAAILVIPFCFVLSKYFFRTKRKKIKKRRVREVAESSSLSRRRVREFEESSSLTELPPQVDTSSGYSVSLSFTTQEEPTDEVTRRVVTTSPVGSGPAENQQAATAHMTINFYGSPAGGAFTMPMTGYPLGYPTTGYVAAAGQPYYYAAAPVGYAATAPAATPTVAAAQPASFAAPACQYAYAVPQPQSVSTHSVSTRSVCSRPSSPVVTRVPAATTVTAQPARTQLYAVPPP
ncbi:hypothetical protein V5799_008800 [Amblyomma americanum]|uniref:POLO box domain-containing protein n=1 Tax=Amblyomma americanum TaxID=6943 RepID=A0AAQ4FDN7_AMBAM